MPETGGDAAFPNMFMAQQALSERTKAYLDGPTASHDAARVFGAIAPRGTRSDRSSHPVAGTRPGSGRKAISVNKQFAAHPVPVPPASALGRLLGHSRGPALRVRDRFRRPPGLPRDDQGAPALLTPL